MNHSFKAVAVFGLVGILLAGCHVSMTFNPESLVQAEVMMGPSWGPKVPVPLEPTQYLAPDQIDAFVKETHDRGYYARICGFIPYKRGFKISSDCEIK